MKNARAKSREKAQELRWSQRDELEVDIEGEATDEGSATGGSDGTIRRPGAGIVNEFIIGLIQHKNAVDNGGAESVASVDLSCTEIVAIKQLSETLATLAIDEIASHLKEGGPRAGQRIDHFFCVVLAAVCQAYATLDEYAIKANEALARAIVDLIGRSTNDADSAPGAPKPRTVQSSKKSSPDVREDSFTPLERELDDFFYRVVLKTLNAIRHQVTAPIEDGVILHLRVIAAITCPDPDRHPSVIKYCIWPLLKGPLGTMISDELAARMETWLVESYPQEQLS